MVRQVSLPRGIRMRGSSYFVDVTIKGVGRKTATVHTLEEALAKQITLRKELLNGGPLVEPTVHVGVVPKEACAWTLKETLNRVLATPYPEGWRGAKSEKKQKSNAKEIMDYFGEDILIADIDEDRIDQLVENLGSCGNSNGTINRKLSTLSKALAFAEKKTKRAYTKPAFPKRLLEPKGRIRQLSPQEEVSVLNCFQKLGDVDGRDFTIILIDTGMRVTECCSITNEDINFDPDNSILLIHGLDAAGTKNGEFRSVPMTSRVREILKRRQFTHPDRPFPKTDNHWFTRKWAKVRALMEKNEDPHFIPHMLRHTCASRLVQKGVSLKVVKDWMGHKSITITMRYAHLYPKDLFDARDALEKPSVRTDETT